MRDARIEDWLTVSSNRADASPLTATGAICSVIKDAGDDPDCTHGAELIAEVELKSEPAVEIRGGEGVATVTKPGLGLEVGRRR